MGYALEEFSGRPVIAILNTWSDIACCHSHFRDRAEQVRRGVWSAGGFPLEIPVASLAEQFQKPSAMMYRNFLAMEAEEVLRSYPIDGAVLMGGCDKTTPALVMGAISADLPAIFLPAGPMLRGNWRGQPVGSGTDVWRFWAERQAGQLDECAWRELEDGIARSPGHCMTMGTASTMTAAVEALGLTLAGASSIPAARFRARSDGRPVRPADRRPRLGGPATEHDPLGGVVRQCNHHGPGTRRVDELDHPSDRDGSARGRRRRTGPVRPAIAHDSGAGRRPARRPFPDGGLLLRGWPARAPRHAA